MSKYLFVPTLLHQNISPWNHTMAQLIICAFMNLLLWSGTKLCIYAYDLNIQIMETRQPFMPHSEFNISLG